MRIPFPFSECRPSSQRPFAEQEGNEREREEPDRKKRVEGNGHHFRLPSCNLPDPYLGHFSFGSISNASDQPFLPSVLELARFLPCSCKIALRIRIIPCEIFNWYAFNNGSSGFGSYFVLHTAVTGTTSATILALCADSRWMKSCK